MVYRNRRTILAGVIIIILLGIAVAMLLPSFGGSDESNFIQVLNTNGGEPLDAGELRLTSANSTTVQGGGSFETEVERLIINDGALMLVVEDVRATIERITAYAEELGGWVVQSNAYAGNSGAVRSGGITMRVPAEQFNGALDAIKAMADSVSSEGITGQDVTQEYVDLNSQIANLQAAEQQLQQIMDDASDTEAVLEVYTELVRIRGEIEVAHGRVNYLSEAAAYSAIRVSLGTEAEAIQTTDDTWRPGDTLADAIDGLTVMVRAIIDLLIYAVVIGIPFVLIVVVPAVFIYRRTEGILPRIGQVPTLTQAPDEESEERDE